MLNDMLESFILVLTFRSLGWAGVTGSAIAAIAISKVYVDVQTPSNVRIY